MPLSYAAGWDGLLDRAVQPADVGHAIRHAEALSAGPSGGRRPVAAVNHGFRSAAARARRPFRYHRSSRRPSTTRPMSTAAKTASAIQEADGWHVAQRSGGWRTIFEQSR